MTGHTIKINFGPKICTALRVSVTDIKGHLFKGSLT